MYSKVNVLGCELDAVCGLLVCMYTYKFVLYKCVQRCFETSQICLLFQLNCWTGRLPCFLVTFYCREADYSGSSSINRTLWTVHIPLWEQNQDHCELPPNKAANINNSLIPNLEPVKILNLQILLAFYVPTPQGTIMFCQIFGLNSYSFSSFSNPTWFSHC